MSKKRKPNMKEAGQQIEKMIHELKPCINASCPNELAMRTIMALIRLSNAFESAGLMPITFCVPYEKEPEQAELFASVKAEQLERISDAH